MKRSNRTFSSRWSGFATVVGAWLAAAGLSIVSLFALADPADSAAHVAQGTVAVDPDAPGAGSAHLDRSGRRQVGKASYYADRYSGRRMADGKPMRLYSNNAASLTLPLGTTARVTNLVTGLSAVVTIEDRGPYVRGRIIDLSPGTARRIGLTRREGVAPVAVVPLTIPMVDGTIRAVSAVVAQGETPRAPQRL